MGSSITQNQKKLDAYVTVAQDGTGDYNGTDETPIQDAIDYLETLSQGGSIYIKAGVYEINNTIHIDGAKHISLIGDGIESTEIYSNKVIDLITIGETSGTNKRGHSIKNIHFVGNDADTLTALKITNQWYCSISNVRIYGCDKGIEILGDGAGSSCALNYISDFSIATCTYGVYMDTINGSNSTSPYNNGNMFTNGYIQQCDTDVYINRPLQASNTGGECAHHKFVNCYIEVNNSAWIMIDIRNSSDNNFSNCMFDGTSSDTQIILDANSQNNYLQGGMDCIISDLGTNNRFMSAGTKGLFGTWDFKDGLTTDTIDEDSSGVGVTIDGALIQDGGASFTSQVKLNNVDANPFKLRRFTSDDQMHEIDIGDENITFTYTQDSDGDAQHFYIFNVVSASTGGGGYFFKENSTTLLKLEKNLNKSYVDFDMNSKNILNVSNVPLVTTGTTAPSTTPAKVGDIFIDTTAGNIYISKGTVNSADWVQVN